MSKDTHINFRYLNHGTPIPDDCLGILKNFENSLPRITQTVKLTDKNVEANLLEDLETVICFKGGKTISAGIYHLPDLSKFLPDDDKRQKITVEGNTTTCRTKDGTFKTFQED